MDYPTDLIKQNPQAPITILLLLMDHMFQKVSAGDDEVYSLIMDAQVGSLMHALDQAKTSGQFKLALKEENVYDKDSEQLFNN